MLDVDYVITIHDEIVLEFVGLPGFAHNGRGGVEAALARIENHALYAGVDDVFAIAALYAVAIAKGHVFNDGNKRTGLTCALTYLLQQEIFIPETPQFEDIMVDVADGRIDHEELASIFSSLWDAGGRQTGLL
ncbi:type II toxin-antitoxin system death-on-curing family toxin [Paenalcaligenes niemegkensis]|uniref:type II toxin-antitoxin system death-on-curing family toxin n=1 Tax=Paenalcaligenes niemegkensis TaxID=2895469 RepID=UPI001EE89223|nr:type II toxin-antitoxin system death-on-curing family toxin [Paenalcaligenes niemegkensis]MCQ9618401.1 type II toxin-antitoxin system death-on-curing family toxin [Paenalcaligenes niemegkensis]